MRPSARHVGTPRESRGIQRTRAHRRRSERQPRQNALTSAKAWRGRAVESGERGQGRAGAARWDVTVGACSGAAPPRPQLGFSARHCMWLSSLASSAIRRTHQMRLGLTKKRNKTRWNSQLFCGGWWKIRVSGDLGDQKKHGVLVQGTRAPVTGPRRAV